MRVGHAGHRIRKRLQCERTEEVSLLCWPHAIRGLKPTSAPLQALGQRKQENSRRQTNKQTNKQTNTHTHSTYTRTTHTRARIHAKTGTHVVKLQDIAQDVREGHPKA
jgi:predicted transcriptional regulator YheO